jgi:hypothetical protein
MCEANKGIHSGQTFLEKHRFNLGEKSHAYLEMDVYSRTAGFGELCRTAISGVTTFDAA